MPGRKFDKEKADKYDGLTVQVPKFIKKMVKECKLKNQSISDYVAQAVSDMMDIIVKFDIDIDDDLERAYISFYRRKHNHVCERLAEYVADLPIFFSYGEGVRFALFLKFMMHSYKRKQIAPPRKLNPNEAYIPGVGIVKTRKLE